ncbi:glycogen debranching enzyme, partial [Acinetobacter baumannii]
KRYYINDTGTGNTVNLSHQRVLQLVADSLRYWATDMRVDGFRFDLATILAREPYGFDEGGGFLDTCRQDPVLSTVKLIAEPW